MSFEILQGDCIEKMRELDEASVDAVVCDPPYGLSREPDIAEVLQHWLAGDDYEHRGGGFMGQSWDSFVPGPAYWRECYRCLKPGGHLLAFAGSRTVDLMGIAIRMAGFEIRDSIMFMYGTGFPKSLDVSKAIDKAARGVPQGSADPTSPNHGKYRTTKSEGKRWVGDSGQGYGAGGSRFLADGTASGSDMAPAASGGAAAAADWQGWGTALKPAYEPIVIARKPLIGTVVENVLEFGTGGINVDACRIDGPGWVRPNGEAGAGFKTEKFLGDAGRGEPTQTEGTRESDAGRWPANVVLSHTEDCVPVGTKKVKVVGATAHKKHHGKGKIVNPGEGQAEHAGYRDPDGTETVEAWECAPGCPVAALDRQSGRLQSGLIRAGSKRDGIGYHGGLGNTVAADSYGDSGGASRFFYCAKTSRSERNAGLEGFEEKDPPGSKRSEPAPGRKSALGAPRANHHPTVKPINLMRWLVRLVTPPGGTCLDPFLGSGSTGCAAVLEGFDFIGFEREPEYVAIAKARIAFWSQHVGQEVDDVLGLHAVSQKRSKAHADQGQVSIDDLLTEEAAA